MTGSSGFLGSTIVQDFDYMFSSIVAVSKSTVGSTPYDTNKKYYAMDICDPLFLDIVQENAPDAIIHTAARSIVRDCEQNPREAFNQNVMGTVNVLEAARKLNPTMPVVVLETDKVYGQQPPACIPTRETDALLGFSPYEYSKVMTANVCDFYRSYYGMNIYSLRPANLFGYRDKNMSRIIPNTFNKLMNNQNPIVFSDSETQIREYVYVNDVVGIIDRMLREKPEPGAYNISSGAVYSPKGIIELIIQTTGIALPIEIVEKPFVFKEIQYQALDGTKLQNLMPFEFTPIVAGISDIWSLHIHNMEKNNAFC